MPFCYDCGASLPSYIPTEREAVGPSRYVCAACFSSNHTPSRTPTTNARLEQMIAKVRVETSKAKLLAEEIKIRVQNL
uniref:Zn_ribbon_2 domain-containing protein n=1 Tax=Steinernema glaseri TaxID=37863 RepID=A0A1I7ZBM7_9BILA